MVKGYFDIANSYGVGGWAWDDSAPEARVSLNIVVDGALAGSVVAQNYRRDLEKAGIGDGKYSFLFQFSTPLSAAKRHVIRVCAQDDGSDIEWSPAIIEPFHPLDATVQTKSINLLPPSGSGEPLVKKIDHFFKEIRLLLEAETGLAGKPALRHIVQDNIRAMLDRFPIQEPQQLSGDVVIDGQIDEASITRISGWACDKSRPDMPLTLLVTDNDILLSRVLANRFRKDLQDAGMGNGRCAFEVDLQGGLSPFERHEIRVRRESDGVELKASPAVIEPTRVMDRTVKEYLAAFFAQAKTIEDISNTIDFMVSETAKLMRQLTLLHGKGLERRDYRQFISRWRRRLPEAEAAVASQTAPKQVLRALVIDDQVPMLDRDAGSNAIISHMLSLQRLGYEVIFTPVLEMRDASPAEPTLASLGIICCRAPYYTSVEDVLAGQAGEFDLIYLHRVHNAAKYSELARTYCPKARLIYSVADLYHIRIARQAQVEDRPELEALSQRTKRAEFLAAAAADAVITHSTFEANELSKHIPATKIYVVPWSIQPRPVETPFSQRSGLAFIGGYSHRPNLDAAYWLISEIMPRVRKYDPTIKCLLVGSNMPDSLRQLCLDDVEAVGYVEDLASIFARIRLTVAPLTFGAGVKGKVLESLAAGIPCVYTSIAAEGITLPAPLRAFVADDADKIAASIQRLHSDEAVNTECRKTGLEFIAASFSSDRIDALIKKAIGPKAVGSAAN